MEETSDKGFELFKSGRISEAITVLEDALKKDPNNVQAAYILGICYFRTKQLDKAKTLFRKVLFLDNRNYKAYYYLGLVLERQNLLDKAVLQYEQALSMKPDFDEAKKKLVSLGQVKTTSADIIDKNIPMHTRRIISSPQAQSRLSPIGALSYLYIFIICATIGLIFGLLWDWHHYYHCDPWDDCRVEIGITFELLSLILGCVVVGLFAFSIKAYTRRKTISKRKGNFLLILFIFLILIYILYTKYLISLGMQIPWILAIPLWGLIAIFFFLYNIPSIGSWVQSTEENRGDQEYKVDNSAKSVRPDAIDIIDPHPRLKTDVDQDESLISGKLLYHGKRRIRSFSNLILTDIIFLIIILYVYIDHNLKNSIGEFLAILIYLFIIILMYIVLASQFTEYWIFENRIDYKTGILSKRQDSIWLYEIENTYIKRSPLNLITNDATVYLVTNRSTPSISRWWQFWGWKHDETGIYGITGLGNYSFMEKFWKETRDSALVERRAMKKWWI